MEVRRMEVCDKCGESFEEYLTLKNTFGSLEN
jgi:hypothetical protein